MFGETSREVAAKSWADYYAQNSDRYRSLQLARNSTAKMAAGFLADAESSLAVRYAEAYRLLDFRFRRVNDARIQRVARR